MFFLEIEEERLGSVLCRCSMNTQEIEETETMQDCECGLAPCHRHCCVCGLVTRLTKKGEC